MLAKLPVRYFGETVRDIGRGMAHVFPNLQIYVPPRPLLLGQVSDVSLPRFIGSAASYALFYAGTLLVVAASSPSESETSNEAAPLHVWGSRPSRAGRAARRNRDTPMVGRRGRRNGERRRARAGGHERGSRPRLARPPKPPSLSLAVPRRGLRAARSRSLGPREQKGIWSLPALLGAPCDRLRWRHARPAPREGASQKPTTESCASRALRSLPTSRRAGPTRGSSVTSSRSTREPPPPFLSLLTLPSARWLSQRGSRLLARAARSRRRVADTGSMRRPWCRGPARRRQSRGVPRDRRRDRR